MQRSIDEATAEIERLQADIEDARLARAQLLQDYGALQAEVKRWQVRWKELDDENRKVWAENDRLKGEIKTYQAQFELQSDENQRLQRELIERAAAAVADRQRLFHYERLLVPLRLWWDARSTWRK